MGLGLLPWMLLAGLLSATLFSGGSFFSERSFTSLFRPLPLFYVLFPIAAMNALGLGHCKQLLSRSAWWLPFSGEYSRPVVDSYPLN